MLYHCSRLIISKLVLECEKLADFQTTAERKTLNDALFRVPFEKEDVFYQLRYCAETFISSKRPISNENLAHGLSPLSDILPDIYPMTCDISIPQTNIYTITNLYRKPY